MYFTQHIKSFRRSP